MKPKTLQAIIRISILVLFVLLVGVLVYSLFYYKEISCDAKLEFIKVNNCSSECVTGCINEGFPISSNHTFLGEKIYIVKDPERGTTKDTKCLCECFGCRN